VSSSPPYPEDPLLRALAEYWDEIQDLADEQQRERLRELVAGDAEPDPLDARAQLADVLLDVLPPEHPVVALLRPGIMYKSGGGVATAEVAESLLRLRRLVLRDYPAGSAGPPAAWPVTSHPADLAEFDRQVQTRLLDLPFLNMGELRRRAIDPDDARLIRLVNPGRGVQYPAFQFTEDGGPWPVVQEVNEQLDALTDPWGVTCWWVDPHAVLAVAPATLLGRGQDDLLRQAAAAVEVD